MPKDLVRDSRFDFRKGRNTAVSPDLLNTDELVDATNARLTASYGGVTKRSGSQKIHANAFAAPIRGVTQWDITSGKQTVVIANGKLYYRNGQSYIPGFTEVTPTGSVARTTANQGSAKGWIDPDGISDGVNVVTLSADGSTTVAAGSRIYNKLGDPTVDANIDAADDRYGLKFFVQADASQVTGAPGGMFTATVTLEYSTNGGGAWTPLPETFTVTAGPGENIVRTFNPAVTVPGSPTQLWIRAILTFSATYFGATGDSAGLVGVFQTTWLTDTYPVTWTTGAGQFSLTEPAFFAPFRANSAGAPLELFIASGGHFFRWTGTTLTQLDPTNAAPAAGLLISFHTRMFASDVNFPKILYWSRIGDATNFTIGSKVDGASATVDFLTGQRLVALEVISSSLLVATEASIMRYTGYSTDDVVIAQGTEGVSSEVGVVSAQGLKRFENYAAALSAHGPYIVTETGVDPIGVAVAPDFDAFDDAELAAAVVSWNHRRQELLFIFGDTVYAYSTRLQAWVGPWVYPFTILCSSNHYEREDGSHTVVVGGSDGFLRDIDAGALDDIAYDGTGGTNIAMRVELPPLQFGMPGVLKALSRMNLQANLPAGSALTITTSFDEDAGDVYSVAETGTGIVHYPIDMNGQGSRVGLVFEDSSPQIVTIAGFVLEAWNMLRQ